MDKWTGWWAFDKFRPYQEEALCETVEAFEKHDVVVAEWTTGSGKTVMATALAKHFGSAYIATAQKYLQDQYERDYSEHLVLLKGKSNYTCTYDWMKKESPTCDKTACGLNLKKKQALNISKYCADNHLCPYLNQRTRAMDSSITLFNYSNLLAFSSIKGKLFGPRNILICDEAHRLESELYKYAELNISRRAFRPVWDLIKNDYEKFFTHYKGFRDVDTAMTFVEDMVGVITEWAATNKNCLDSLEETPDEYVPDVFETYEKQYGDPEQKPEPQHASALEELKNMTEEDLSIQKDIQALLATKSKLSSLLTMYKEGTKFVLKTKQSHYRGKNWVTSTLSPLKVDHLNYLAFRLGKKVLLMSGTIGDHKTLTTSLGIKDYAFVTMPFSFTQHENPIYYYPVGSMSRKERSNTLPKMVRALKALARNHSQEKGLVHTFSYDIAKELYEYLKNDPRYLFQLSAQDKDVLYEKHLTGKDPTILVGPGYKEGADFKGKSCEWMAIIKMPYADLGDPIVAARKDEDARWYGNLCAIDLVQMLGRPIRDMEDQAVRYILDKAFGAFRYFNGDLIPEYITERIYDAESTK